MKLPFYQSRCIFLEKAYEFSVKFYQIFFKRKTLPWAISLEQLSSFNTGTLGNDLYLFLTKNNFKLQPKLESHDVFHVLTKIGVTVPDEISMQFMLFGNGRKSLYGIATMIMGLFIIPEHLMLYLNRFTEGRNMTPFYNLDFENLLSIPSENIREIISSHKFNYDLIT